MINNLYIFMSSGKLLFTYNWKQERSVEEDPVLISGFLSAIWMFAQKIGSKGVRAIQTENNLLVGVSSPKYDLLFVLVADSNSDIAACKHLLTRIRQSFIQKFRRQLQQDYEFGIDDFNEWRENLERLTDDMDVAPVESVMKKFLKNIVNETKDNSPSK
ncbi:MAG: hypothetical protein ACTSYB_03680 [Candidatus Helarchaeota archaeon]